MTFARNLARLMRSPDDRGVLTYVNFAAAIAAGFAIAVALHSVAAGLITVLPVFLALFAALSNKRTLKVAAAACTVALGGSVATLAFFFLGPLGAALFGGAASAGTALLYWGTAKDLAAQQADTDWY